MMALQLAERVVSFLQESGGAYENLTSETELNVFYCIGARQYVIRESDGVIEYFACYWRIHPDDVPSVQERVKPLDLITGSVMYVVEAACKSSIREMIKDLRRTSRIRGVFWHRPAKEDKVYSYMSQRSRG